MVLAVALAGVAVLLPGDPWRTSLLSIAVVSGVAAVVALVDSVRFRSRLPSTWTEL